jgi:hypothetical protein
MGVGNSVRPFTFILAAAAAAAVAGSVFSTQARATAVPVVNFSFENPTTTGFIPIGNSFPARSGVTMTATPNDWCYVGPQDTSGTTTGNQHIANNGMTLGTGDGIDSGYINNGPNSNNNNTPQYLLQDVGGIASAGTQYTLTVAYANRAGFGIGATGRMALYSVPQTAGGAGAAVTDQITAFPPSAASDPAWTTWWGTATLLASVDAPVQADNAFHDFITSYTATGADVGKDLLVVLTQTADASAAQRQANFDNVRLDAVIPEPAALGCLALMGAGAISRRRRSRA